MAKSILVAVPLIDAKVKKLRIGAVKDALDHISMPILFRSFLKQEQKHMEANKKFCGLDRPVLEKYAHKCYNRFAVHLEACKTQDDYRNLLAAINARMSNNVPDYIKG